MKELYKQIQDKYGMDSIVANEEEGYGSGTWSVSFRGKEVLVEENRIEALLLSILQYGSFDIPENSDWYDVSEDNEVVQEKVTMSKEVYDYLVKSSRMLEQLKVNGVDNWEYYGCMCREKGENSCIFCEDDE